MTRSRDPAAAGSGGAGPGGGSPADGASDGSDGSSASIRGKLLRSHLMVGAIGVTLLLLTLGAALWLRDHATRLATVRGPVVRNSMNAQGAVQRSTAALRGWVLLGDSAFLADRDSAWREEIRPSVARLRDLLESDPGRGEDPGIPELEDALERLRAAQWWVADVAHTPGNEPARVLHARSVDPIADRVTERISTLIGELESPGSRGRMPETVTAMHEFRFAFAQFRTLLSDYLESGGRADRRAFRRRLRSAGAALDRLRSLAPQLPPDVRGAIREVGREFGALDPYMERIVEAREGPRWNLARFWLATGAEPQTRRVRRMLSEISDREGRAMQRTADRVVSISRIAAGTGLVFVLVMALAAWILARSNAERLSGPIRQLARASRELARGGRGPELEVRTDDELGDLTRSFNAMRRALARRTEELRSFTYAVAHDLGTPLRAVKGFSRALEEDHAGDLDPEGRRLLEKVRANAGRLEELLDGLLTLSRVGRREIRRQAVDMEAMVREVFREQAAEDPRGGGSPVPGEEGGSGEGADVQLVVGDLPPATGDPTLLRQVWRNLISNALKFTRPRQEARIEVTHEWDRGAPAYCVRDDGVGFDEDRAERMFEVFQRGPGAEEFEGTGVGLAIVRRIVERHGGRIRAESPDGGGARFWFTLPED